MIKMCVCVQTCQTQPCQYVCILWSAAGGQRFVEPPLGNRERRARIIGWTYHTHIISVVQYYLKKQKQRHRHVIQGLYLGYDKCKDCDHMTNGTIKASSLSGYNTKGLAYSQRSVKSTVLFDYQSCKCHRKTLFCMRKPWEVLSYSADVWNEMPLLLPTTIVDNRQWLLSWLLLLLIILCFTV